MGARASDHFISTYLEMSETLSGRLKNDVVKEQQLSVVCTEGTKCYHEIYRATHKNGSQTSKEVPWECVRGSISGHIVGTYVSYDDPT